MMTIIMMMDRMMMLKRKKKKLPVTLHGSFDSKTGIVLYQRVDSSDEPDYWQWPVLPPCWCWWFDLLRLLLLPQRPCDRFVRPFHNLVCVAKLSCVWPNQDCTTKLPKAKLRNNNNQNPSQLLLLLLLLLVLRMRM